MTKVEGIVIALLLAVLMWLLISPQLSYRGDLAPSSFTRLNLNRYEHCVKNYRIGSGEWPDPMNLQNQLVPCMNMMKLDDSGRDPLLDGWGRPIKYEINEDGNYLIYSFGENGLDDHGQGDDVVRPYVID